MAEDLPGWPRSQGWVAAPGESELSNGLSSGTGSSPVGMAGVSRTSLAAVGGVAAVATLLLLLVLWGTIPVLQSPPQPGSCGEIIGCGTFAAGNPRLGVCPLGGTIATTGCFVGDFVYNLAIETADTTFGGELFHVETPNETVYIATGGESGFSILDSAGAVAAYYPAADGTMNMTSGWIYRSGASASTILGSTYTILVDMGTVDPLGQGYTFVAVGTGGSSGTAALALP